MRQVVKLTLEYDGTNYSGWQLQSGQDSIQARIEAALERIFFEPVRVYGAGRTDAGVHALGQVAAISLPRAFDFDDLSRALNALLPPDIVVLDATPAAEGFDPRRDARSRVYGYRLLNRDAPSALEYRRAWHVRDHLDVDAMNRAAHVFVGEHDFAAFRTLGSEEKTTMRRIDLSEWSADGERVVYRVEASSFLRRMVRTMVAAMVDAGRARIGPEAIGAMLAACDRAQAPAAAPPHGLYLVAVRY